MGIDPGGINRGRIPVTGTTKDMAERADLHSALEGPAEQKATQGLTKTRYVLLIDFDAPSRDQFMIIRCDSDVDHSIVARAGIEEEARMIVKALNALSKTEAGIDAAVEKALRALGLGCMGDKSCWDVFVSGRLACIREWLDAGATIGEITKRLSADETEIAKIALTVIDTSKTGEKR